MVVGQVCNLSRGQGIGQVANLSYSQLTDCVTIAENGFNLKLEIGKTMKKLLQLFVIGIFVTLAGCGAP